MGVSFYAVLEYEEYNSYWSFGKINIPRDYKLFSAIAFGDGSMTDNMPHPPKEEIPRDCSSEVRNLFFVTSDEVTQYLAISRLDDDEETTLEEYAEGHGKWAVEEYKNSGLLPQPELYGYSWLNFNELKESLVHAKLKTNDINPVFRAVLAAMEALSETYTPEKVRLVFWWGM